MDKVRDWRVWRNICNDILLLVVRKSNYLKVGMVEMIIVN